MYIYVMFNFQRRRPEVIAPPVYDYWNPVKDVKAYIPPPDYSPPTQPRFYRGPQDRTNIYSIQ